MHAYDNNPRDEKTYWVSGGKIEADNIFDLEFSYERMHGMC